MHVLIATKLNTVSFLLKDAWFCFRKLQLREWVQTANLYRVVLGAITAGRSNITRMKTGLIQH